MLTATYSPFPLELVVVEGSDVHCFLGVADFHRVLIKPMRRSSMTARPTTHNHKHKTSSDRRDDVTGEVNQAVIDSHIYAAFSNISG